MRKRNKLFKFVEISLFYLSISLLFSQQQVNCEDSPLYGVGLFQRSEMDGLDGISMDGGTEILIIAESIGDSPSENLVSFYSSEVNQQLPGYPLSKDNEFNSDPMTGKLQYTTPSLTGLFGLPEEAFSSYESITLDLNVFREDPITGNLRKSQCIENLGNCKINFRRNYTPLLYYMAPSVVYQGLEVALLVDPKNSQSLRKSGDLPFKEIRLDGELLDFEGYIDNETSLYRYSKNEIKGKVTDQNPSQQTKLTMKFESGNARQLDYSMYTCDINNQNCYKVRTVPKIDSINTNQGYITGGQTLTIQGHGLFSEEGDIDIHVDGHSCKVMSYSNKEITCETSKSDTPSIPDEDYVGQNGVRRRVYNSDTTSIGLSYYTQYDYQEELATSFEANQRQSDYYGNTFSGYFKAPVTSNYRFYAACDNRCQVYLSNVTEDPSEKQQIINLGTYTGYRNYRSYQESQSEWFFLTVGEYYFIELQHIAWGGNDYTSLAVEIEQDAIQDHHHVFKETQRLQINPENIREKTKLIIENPDSGYYTLRFMNPETLEYTTFQDFRADSTANELRNLIRGYYSRNFGAPISVDLEMFDENSTLTDDMSQSEKNEYTITVHRSLSVLTVSSIIASGDNTTSTFSYINPSQLQRSSQPLSGSYTLTCYKKDESSSTTEEISVHSSPTHVYNQIIKNCPEYRDIIEVSDGGKYKYTDDGVDLVIDFLGVNRDVQQFTLASGTVEPLDGNNVQIDNLTPFPYSSNLFYHEIPFEWLYTNETSPQVTVSVNGLPAVCASLECDFLYVEPVSEVTTFDLAGNTLTIQGTNLPVESLKSLNFANIKCDIDTSTETNIQCTLQNDPAAGDWYPQVKDEFGLIPIDETVNPLSIEFSVTQVEATTAELNPNGNQILTITGTGFPASLDNGDDVAITIQDNTECKPISSTTTEIQCLTQKFSVELTELSINIEINGKSDNSNIVNIGESTISVVEISPSQVSPVLKTFITLSLDENFADTLDKEDLSVSFISKSDSTYTIQARVVEVNNVDKEIIVKFGGAKSGKFDVSVHSQEHGQFNTDVIVLETVGKITSFSPQQGSVNGGTLVTVNGYVFSDDPLDNNVKVGKTDCLVISSSPDEIKCRTEARKPGGAQEEAFLVFLRAAEEAVCEDPSGSCIFEWLDEGIPTITSMSVNFEESLQEYVLKIQGQDFTGNQDSVEIIVDGQEQNVISHSPTEIVATINHAFDTTTNDIKVYFPEGIPNGQEILEQGIELQPTLIQIHPQQGSRAGSIIKATVKGVGAQTTDLDLVLEDGTSLCSKVDIKEYGEVICHTKQNQISQENLIKVKYGSTTNECQNSDQSLCQYMTFTTVPTVTSMSITDGGQSITFDGTDFFTGDYTANVKYAGVEATSVDINSDNEVVAHFDKGVPHHETGEQPQLLFINGDEQHYAQVDDSLINVLDIQSFSNGIECSFAGGCMIEIEATGLASSLENQDDSVITVCDEECEYQPSESTATITKCQLPTFSNILSFNNYQVRSQSQGDSKELIGEGFSSNSDQTDLLFNNRNNVGFTDTSSECYFGIELREGHIGILKKVSFFLQATSFRNNYIDQLIFQGSNDGTNYEDIFTVGEEIKSGWNNYQYEDGEEPNYRFFKFFGQGSASCVIGEVKFYGAEVLDDNSATYTCTPQLQINGNVHELTGGEVIYTHVNTAKLTSITPRYGLVKGGEVITLNGENLDADHTKYTIKIDDVECTPTEATTQYVKCETGERPGIVPETTLEILIDGKGKVATQGLKFLYVNYWSDEDTWGGEFAPMEGESVHIPKGLNLLVDVDSTPLLNAVIVEGSLIFQPHQDENHVSTFEAHYILVKGGYLEVGTEEFPFSSKLVITMHGERNTPEIPIFGNKCIAVMRGQLELHGMPRTPTWTDLSTTANAGDNQITLNQQVDWKVDEKIVIAPTGYDNHEAEERTIVDIDNTDPTKPIITLNKALNYKHYAGVETYGGQELEMRAEVGLLTRNVIFRGDTETSERNKFGAHIMLHSEGDDSVVGKIEYIELFDVGQAFQLGRYPIHFHMIGAIHKSYIKGNSIHHTYNRACTIHGVHYLRLIRNVAYHTMGHTFFVEDAIETNNYLEENLSILTKRSWSLLNTDTSPASFWITNPDNIFRNNRAAGSDRYGYWFDLQVNPTGPSFDPNICPINMKLGEFIGNVAHTNGRYGLRIFHGHVPRKYPCRGLSFDSDTPEDPYHQNPLITAEYRNFLGYKNGRNGAIAETVGDVRFIDFKTADNILAGIEFSLTDQTMDGTAQINGALIVAHSANADDKTLSSSAHGIITPRTENFQIHNVDFYNFDKNQMAALGSCSHCFHAAATDSGARTVKFSNLYFDGSVTRKIKYQQPFRAIYLDLDGSLTGLGANTWATSYWEHNVQPECEVNSDVYDGIICDNTVQVRRIAFHNYSPGHFAGVEMNILKWDDEIVEAKTETEIQAYLEDTTQYSIIPFKPKKSPSNAWAIPMVTDHKYKVHWGYGLDFTQMHIQISERWEDTDKDLYLVMNFTDVREKVEVTTGGEEILNQTLVNKTEEEWLTGDNVVYNDTETREIHMIINGKDQNRNSVKFKGYRCIYNCNPAIEDKEIEDEIRRWSNPSAWDDGKVPEEGEDVEIQPGWNMVFDLEESPKLANIQINGRLSFLQGIDSHLQAKTIWVRSGELIIGNEDEPYIGNAKITLYGDQQSEHIAVDNQFEAGNKVIVNTGVIRMHGINRDNKMSRLVESVQPGQEQINVETGLDWSEGDEIALAPTANTYNDSDYAIITSYDTDTGIIILDRQLTAYHYGASQSTADDYSGVDMRGEVFLLSRNIKIEGNDTDGWGGQIVVSEFIEEDDTYRQGHLIMDNVQVRNCSQRDTWKSALRFERALNSWNKVSNSVFHHGLGWGLFITQSRNIEIENNVFFDFSTIGINIMTSNNITLDGNALVRVTPRDLEALDMYVDPSGGIMACGYNYPDSCQDIKVTNNIVSGVDYAGYGVFGHDCGDYNDKAFKNNIAHSVNGIGAIIYPNQGKENQAECFEGSYFTAYKNVEQGALTYFDTREARFTNMVLIDNGFNIGMLIGREGDDLQIKMDEIKIYGETEARDCFYENQCQEDSSSIGCINKYGMMLPYFSQGGKVPYPRMESALPLYKVKSDASWGGASFGSNIEFINYKSKQTYCGTQQAAFLTNPHGADYVPILSLRYARFNNVDQNAVAWLMDPPSGWATLDDCGEFPCTAPKNVLIRFEQTTYTGHYTPINYARDFQIISNNEKVAEAAGCRYFDAWNANFCQNNNLGMLLFESLDEDKYDRTVSPIIITSKDNDVYWNKLNTFMDHVWDGFYTGQVRLSRFPAIIEGGDMYEVYYTGTPPSKQRYKYIGDQNGIVVEINYPKAGAYQIRGPDGQIIDYNDWNEEKKQMGDIKRNKCGENRFVGVVNILQFFLPFDCQVTIEPRDAIMTNIRLEWTLEEFYADGGTTRFADRLAASLGIHPSTIKVVAVYQGSVIVNFLIYEENDDEEELEKIQENLIKQIQEDQIDLGAPIIEATSNGQTVKETGDEETNPDDEDQNNTDNENDSQDNDQQNEQDQQDETKDQGPMVEEVENSQPDVKESSNLSTIFLVVGSILAVAVIGSLIGLVIYKKTKKPNSPVQQSVTQTVQHASSPGPEEEEYEPQYHPKSELGNIFGVEQLKEKVNKADSFIQEDQSNEEDGQTFTNQSIFEDVNNNNQEENTPLSSTRKDEVSQNMKETKGRDFAVKVEGMK